MSEMTPEQMQEALERANKAIAELDALPAMERAKAAAALIEELRQVAVAISYVRRGAVHHLLYVDKLSKRALAAELGIHASSVLSVLKGAGFLHSGDGNPKRL